MFSVSVAQVMWCTTTRSGHRCAERCRNFSRKNLAPATGSPSGPGKSPHSGTAPILLRPIFSRKRSRLLRKSTRAAPRRCAFSQTSSQSSRASTIRFLVESSKSRWSNSASEATKITAVTLSKWWIHLRRSLRWPPTPHSAHDPPPRKNPA
ncbi:unnamed protein product [Heterosigma akashiwo]